MQKTDILIVGAGVVGLAIAEHLSKYRHEIVLIEKHDGFGREASSRNSEVLHAGLYHNENLLKTKLCVRGNRLLYNLCEHNNIPHLKIGKILVAQNQSEISRLEDVRTQAIKNGAGELKFLSSKEMNDFEPFVRAAAGLHSPETGIIDSHSLMSFFEETAKSKGTIIAYNCELLGLEKTNDSYKAAIRDADGEIIDFASNIVINAAGLCADVVAGSLNLDIDALGYKIYPCKGEYFSVSGKHKGKMRHLIYPTPVPGFSGNHPTISLDGRIRIGPNLFYVDEINYSVDDSHRIEFFHDIQSYLPFIEYDDLSPDMAGIRPKLYKKGQPFRDFVIQEESGKGFAGFINLIGIESPGLTACMAIAEYVENIINNLS